jgi:hypothetical protein
LSFRRNPFKGLTYTFDPVLKLCAIRRKQAHDLVSADRGHGKSGPDKINDLPNAKLMARHVCLLVHLGYAPS